jgi:hypothetical protein
MPNRTDSSPHQEERMKIQITIGNQRLQATIFDSPAGRDLIAQLPLTIDMIDQAMNPTYDFTGKVALVTGASSGMGLATAQAFAASGAAVVLADINDQSLQAATAGLRAQGTKPSASDATCPTRSRSPPWSIRPSRPTADSTWPSTTPASRPRRRARRDLRPRQRRQPARSLGLHET